MIDSYFTYEGRDGTTVAARKWLPNKAGVDAAPVRAVVQIVHGMAEHIGRYDHLAKFLAANAGIVTAGHDQRGHGRTAPSPHLLGRVHEDWEEMLYDVRLLSEQLRKLYPDRPLFLLGHSFGSLIVRAVVQRGEIVPDGMILSGTLAARERERKYGKRLAQLQAPLLGRTAKARLLSKLTFSGYNRGFAPKHTAYDWLSRDKKIVADYIEDPYCGQTCSVQFYLNLFKGMDEVFAEISEQSNRKIPFNLPVLLFAGDEDPVGSGSEGTIRAEEDLLKIGLTDVTRLIYKGGRHEMLNETNRYEVYQDLLTWLKKRFY